MDVMVDPLRRKLMQAMNAAAMGEEREARMALYEAMALMDNYVPAS